MIRAFVIDDEPLALRRLVRMIEESGRATIGGSSSDPVEALDRVRTEKPDVLFLDIQMPGMNGFEFLAALGPSQPVVVFTTAYNQYALKAFEVNSIDYLLKPVEPHQLQRALNKLDRMQRGTEPRPEMEDLLRRLASALQTNEAEYATRLPSRTGDRIEFVELARVTHIYAKDKLTFAATPAKDYCLDGSIVELEAKLDPKRFVRIHRSTLVNIDHVQELYTWFAGRMLVRLKDEKRTELTVARDRVRALKERLHL